MRFNILIILFASILFSGCEKKADLQEIPTPLIIFTDCGAEIDDQWMLISFMGMEDVDILGVYSSHHGSRSLTNESQHSLEILDEVKGLASMTEIPTFLGSPGPLQSRTDIRHGTADSIKELIEGYSYGEKVTVIISGPATDLASALLKYPELEERIEIYATAFYSREIGSSYNVHNDPIAWQYLLERNMDITVSPNSVSKDSFLISTDEMLVITNQGNSVSDYLSENFLEWLIQNNEIVTHITGSEDTWPIWDLILPACIAGYCQYEETERPILLDNGYFNYTSSGDKTIRWVTNCDSSSTWNDFRNYLNEFDSEQ